MKYQVIIKWKRLVQCRPPGIYKGDYIKDLFARYGGNPEEIPPAPPLPDWCFEEEDGPSDEEDGGQLNGGGGFGNQRSAKRKRRTYNEVRVFTHYDIQTLQFTKHEVFH